MRNLIICILLFLIGLGTLNAQTVRYVKSDGLTAADNAAEAISWAAACNDLQAVINASASGDEIWVATGTYQPVFGHSFNIKKGIKTYGGFAGTEIEFSDRNLTERLQSGDTSILKGNDSRVVMINGADIDTATVLNGFTITGGSAARGGGLYNHLSSPTIAHCIFRDNEATGVGEDEGGGAIYNSQSNAAISNCLFQNNTASNGAGIFNYERSRPAILNSTFKNNIAITNGGAICNYNIPTPFLINVTPDSNTENFNDNEDESFFNSSLVILNSVFSNNSAAYGGALHNSNNILLTTTNSTFFNNTANSGANDIMNIAMSFSLIKNSILWGNPENSMVNAVYSESKISYSLLQQSVCPEGVTCNNVLYNQDPLFIDAANGDYGLRSCSPAINTGIIDTVGLNLPLTDIAGNPRIQFDRIDMGAYETNAQPSSTAVSSNSTTTVNIQSPSATTWYGDSCNGAIAAVTGGGDNPISGNTLVKLWVQTNQSKEYVKRHYEITPDSNPEDATGRVTLYFTNEEFADFNNQTPQPALLLPDADDEGSVNSRKSNLRIEKRAGTSNDNSGLPNSYTGGIETIDPDDNDIVWNATAQRWEVSFDVTGFSGFFVKTQEAILPLKLVSFTAKEENCKVLLNWVTVQEQNVSHFEIEESADGSSFLPARGISSIPAQNTSVKDNYTAVVSPNGTTAYYRLKMIDIDGGYSYSGVVLVTTDCSQQRVVLYPNPVKEQLWINVSKSGIDYVIYDNVGKKVLGGILKNSETVINVSGLASGVYFIVIEGVSYKILKE